MELDYVRGFFDRLCSVSDRAITLTTDQVELGRMVGSTLRLSKIPCSIKIYNGRIKLRIAGKGALQRFQQEIGFEDQSKKKKLDELIHGPNPTSE